MKNLFLIPARSNSKRLKDKNLANLASRPLIYHTIKICENFKKTADIFVSSDSSKILNYCKKFSFIKTRKRPKKFATNKSNLVDVAFDVLKNLNNFTYENIILLQPTSPLRTAEDFLVCFGDRWEYLSRNRIDCFLFLIRKIFSGLPVSSGIVFRRGHSE